MTPDHVFGPPCTLGEGIQWHDGDLWWTDIQGRQLHRLAVSSGRLETMDMPERLASFALSDEAGRLLCAFETGLAWFDVATLSLQWLVRPEQPGSGVRFNDGRADRRGRFWVGTMAEDPKRSGGRLGALHRLDARAALTVVAPGIGISNGLAWSPDGGTLYFADSTARTIWNFSVDVATGALSRRRIFAQTPEGAYPDGGAVDAEGCYWSAQWGASRVVRFRPDGSIDRIVETPVTQPSCVAFAGDDLRLLCITSARDGLSDQQIASEPLAGHVLAYRCDVGGLPEARVAAECLA